MLKETGPYTANRDHNIYGVTEEICGFILNATENITANQPHVEPLLDSLME